MKTKFEIKSVAGNVLFEHKSENLKDTLVEAIRQGADLRGAYLGGADLRGADLRGAYLGDADLRDAYLRGAYLRGAELGGAYLGGAYLGDADLRDAYLRGAELGGADLRGAYLDEKQLPPINCPSEGEFTAFKKLRNNVIATLLIPADAKRTSSIGRKCRAEFAKVIALHDEDGEIVNGTEYDRHSFSLEYEVGKIVRPDSYNPDRRLECTNGIHFFITKQEAIDYI